jgi:hypothetical protein
LAVSREYFQSVLVGAEAWAIEQAHEEFSNLERELAAVTAEKEHWKANAKNQAEIRRTIATRPDLKERAEYVLKIVAERDAANAELAACREALDCIHALAENAVATLSIMETANCSCYESTDQRCDYCSASEQIFRDLGHIMEFVDLRPKEAL